jgi:hypothetical protein
MESTSAMNLYRGLAHRFLGEFLNNSKIVLRERVGETLVAMPDDSDRQRFAHEQEAVFVPNVVDGSMPSDLGAGTTAEMQATRLKRIYKLIEAVS